MAKKRAALSKGEMVVAGALWRLGKATLGELFDEVNEAEAMEYATVQSYIRRLEAKGYVKSKKVGRNNLYSAKISPATVIGQTVDQMLQQLFAGDAMPVLRHLIQNRGVSSEELSELRELIDGAEDGVAEKHDD